MEIESFTDASGQPIPTGPAGKKRKLDDLVSKIQAVRNEDFPTLRKEAKDTMEANKIVIETLLESFNNLQDVSSQAAKKNVDLANALEQVKSASATADQQIQAANEQVENILEQMFAFVEEVEQEITNIHEIFDDARISPTSLTVLEKAVDSREALQYFEESFIIQLQKAEQGYRDKAGIQFDAGVLGGTISDIIQKEIFQLQEIQKELPINSPDTLIKAARKMIDNKVVILQQLAQQEKTRFTQNPQTYTLLPK